MTNIKLLAQQCVKDAEKPGDQIPDSCKEFFKNFLLNQPDVKIDCTGKIESMNYKNEIEYRGPSRMPGAWRSKMLKRALKELFPDTKFSVRLDSYSMGDSIDAGWTDGPAEHTVNHTGMRGMFESVDRDERGEILSGGNSFVFTRRDISPEKRAWAENEIKTKFNVDDQKMKYDSNYGNMVWRLLKRTDFRKSPPRILEGEY